MNMKKILLSAIMAILTMTAAAQSKTLVAYFSFTNNTKGIAEDLADVAGADLYAITPVEAYESNNSNYYDSSTRAYQEQYGPASARPAIQETLIRTDYDVILLGFPIWYGKVPRLILTFLDKYGFAGKTVIPFCTSGSSGISGAESELHSTYPGINWKAGARLNGKGKSELKEWYDSFGLTSNQEENMEQTINLTIDGNTKKMSLVDNQATRELVERLKDGDITVSLTENGFEQYGDLGRTLTTSNESITAKAGDVLLYASRYICFFYGENSYSYTRLGKVEYQTLDELKSFFKAGQSNVKVKLSLANTTGIGSVHGQTSSDVYYSLNGQRVNNPKHGIYIKNGKKVIL
jgi:flavodoxin